MAFIDKLHHCLHAKIGFSHTHGLVVNWQTRKFSGKSQKSTKSFVERVFFYIFHFFLAGSIQAICLDDICENELSKLKIVVVGWIFLEISHFSSSLVFVSAPL